MRSWGFPKWSTFSREGERGGEGESKKQSNAFTNNYIYTHCQPPSAQNLTKFPKPLENDATNGSCVGKLNREGTNPKFSIDVGTQSVTDLGILRQMTHLTHLAKLNITLGLKPVSNSCQPPGCWSSQPHLKHDAMSL